MNIRSVRIEIISYRVHLGNSIIPISLSARKSACLSEHSYTMLCSRIESQGIIKV